MPLRPPAGYIRPGYNPLQVANAPTVGTASAGDTTASVAFTAPSNVGGGAISLYYAVSSPGQFTGTSVTSPVTVTGLTNGTSYTFTVWAANPFGPSPYSASSNSVTPSFTYIEDVFSTWLYTGTGAAQTITNGIDLAGKGGLVWFKDRTVANSNRVFDTARGTSSVLTTNSTGAAFTSTNMVTAFNTNGFSLGIDTSGGVNDSGSNFVSWTFREQPKFFDVVTYTGTGSVQNIAHNLGSVPGCIIVKSMTDAVNWNVYHRSVGSGSRLILNTTDAALSAATTWNNTDPTSTQFTVGTSSQINFSGSQYVAYLFAHDAGGFGLTGTDNVISCGSFTADGSGGATVNLGYEPQWVMWKRSDGTGDWTLLDNMRGWGQTIAQRLVANTSAAENSMSGGVGFTPFPTATGFFNGNQGAAFATYIYIAIRRGPMRTPTSGTSVFSPVAYTGTGATRTITAGFPVDWAIPKSRQATGNSAEAYTRLIGPGVALLTAYNFQELSRPDELTSFASNTGVVLGASTTSGGTNMSGTTYVDWNFARAPGFFDVVCYTGTSSATTQAHNLGVVPELIIIKARISATNWTVYTATTGTGKGIYLNSTSAEVTFSQWVTSTSSTTFGLGTGTNVNGSGDNYVAYLFASCPGVSKVGSYTGTGALQTINCGFTGGARFVLIKRTDSTGDWFTYDSARGITSGNDPYLLMNSTAAEVTGTNYVDTTSVGFQVTAAAPAGLNASGGTYIYLAIA